MKRRIPGRVLALALACFAAGTAFRQDDALSEEQRLILEHMRWIEVPDGRGGAIGTVRFEGVDVQIVNGAGRTDAIDGSGNLIVGYNETGCRYGDLRSGSHNLVVGSHNSYSSYGGVVAAHGNAIVAPFTCVTGGEYNRAEGYAASVLGGLEQVAQGDYSTVSGGKFNRASGTFATVSGGHLNVAAGLSSACSAGFRNYASGIHACVSGGVLNKACGQDTVVSGGLQCIINGSHDWGAGTLIKDF